MRVYRDTSAIRPRGPPQTASRFGAARGSLITSSLSGIALVERARKQSLFYATGENAHSADLLPGNRLAVATSGSHPEAMHRGNPSRLTIFEAALPERELYHTDLPWGHGVVWDEDRQLLWALAINDLRAYRLAAWETDHPSLELSFTLDLPEGGAHDLAPVPASSLLMLTTEHHCWLFDRDTRALRPHPQLAEASAVKSLSLNPITGQLAYVQAEGETWWANRVRFLNPEAVVERPEEIVYKARWNAV